MTESQQPIRVLNLMTTLNRGGAETMVMNYYRHIDRTKVQFDFVVHREEKGAYEDEILAMGGRIFRMQPVRPWTRISYNHLIRDFYKEHPEYCVIHSHMSELGAYAFKAADDMGIPIRICHAHLCPHGIDLKTVPRFFLNRSMRKHLTHRFMCSTEAGIWQYGKAHTGDMIMLNNAVEAATFRFDPERRAAARDALGLTDELVVGHVGRFNYQKNHPFLIDTFAALHRKMPQSVLLLVGDGTDRPAIEEKIKHLGLENAVRLLGVRNDVPDLLQAMDVFAFPSLYEGLSVALVEVQAAGLPCLISDRMSLECKVTDLVHVKPLADGPEAWADAMLRLAEKGHSDTYAQIVENKFDITENARWLQEFYLSCVKGD